MRVYQTNERQHFHTDSSDVVGLMCLKEARHGGISMLASSITVYNEFKSKFPHLLKYLFKPISRDRRGEIPTGEKPFYNLSVLHWYKDKLTGVYHRGYIDSAQNYSDSIKLSKNHNLLASIIKSSSSIKSTIFIPLTTFPKTANLPSSSGKDFSKI